MRRFGIPDARGVSLMCPQTPAAEARASRMLRCQRWFTRLGVLACLGLLQCTAVQPVPLHSPFQGVPSAIRIDPQFRDGLECLVATKSWPLSSNADDFDWLLLGVKVQWQEKDERRERIWFVRIAETIDPEEAAGGRVLANRRFEYDVPFGVGAIRADSKFTVSCRRIRIETYDERGEFIAQWSRLAPEIFPDASVYQALATLPQRGPLGLPLNREGEGEGDDSLAMVRSLPPAALDALQRGQDRGMYEMVATLQTLGMTPPLASIRELVKDHVVSMPSIFSFLLSGLKPTVAATLSSATPCEFPWVLDRVQVPAYQAEFTTLLAGERMFDCRMVAGPSVPPMDLLGGLLVIEAAHPDNPGNRLTVRVLASSRARLGVAKP